MFACQHPKQTADRVPARQRWMSRIPGLTLHLLAALLLTVAGWQAPLAAEEPCEEFLQALQKSGYFDVAMDYLDDMSQSDLASEGFRRRIPLLKVAILLDETALIRDNERVTRQLDRTEQILDEFIATDPASDLLAEAQEQRANIAMGRARRLLDRSESDRITVQQRDEYRQQARDYLNEANQTFEMIRQRLRTDLEDFRIDPQDPNSNQRLERLRNDYIKIRMKSPRVKEQIADSFGPDDPQYQDLLDKAASEYLELFEKYRTRLSGIDGCLGAARCYQKTGNSNKALGYLLEVFDLPLGQIQNLKKREAALIAIDAWESVDPYPAQEAFARLQPVIYSMPPEFARTGEGVRLRMAFARICHNLATAIRENGASTAEERKQMTMLDREATNIMRSLSRMSGPHREEARSLMDAWGNAVSRSEPAAESGPPESMNEARQRGTDIQLDVAELLAERKDRQQDLASAGQADIAELQSEIDELQNRINQRSAAALDLFDLALAMGGPDAADDDLANLRYLQAASWFQMDRFFETAIIGEFLAERFPDNSGTRQAVGLVCKAYWQIYLQNRNSGDSATANTEFELDQLTQYSQLIFDRWPESDQAETAGVLMTLLALDRNDPLRAGQYLEKIPSESPARGAVLLEVGNKMWRRFVLDQRKGQSNPQHRQQARRLLEDGMEFLEVDSLTPYHARSALSLTELYLDAGDSDAALQQLEQARIAPLDLVKNKHPAAADPQFRRDTFRTAVRTYLAKLKNAETPLEWVEKSRGVLEALKQDIGQQPDGQKQLTGIYLTLSRELKQQFDSLQDNAERNAFADGLESFLQALADNTNDRQLMLLTGTMLTDIGSSLKQNGLSAQADRFFGMAVEVYAELGETRDPDPRIQLAVNRGRANSLRGSGRYEEAMVAFAEILKVPENRRYQDIQLDAARTLAEWGLEKSDPTALARAVQGAEKVDGSNAIMGWINLAKVAQRDRNMALFAECVYHIANCKFRYGEIRQQPGLQESAVAEIRKFREKVPDMGGPPWQSRLEQLESQLRARTGSGTDNPSGRD